MAKDYVIIRENTDPELYLFSIGTGEMFVIDRDLAMSFETEIQALRILDEFNIESCFVGKRPPRKPK